MPVRVAISLSTPCACASTNVHHNHENTQIGSNLGESERPRGSGARRRRNSGLGFETTPARRKVETPRGPYRVDESPGAASFSGEGAEWREDPSATRMGGRLGRSTVAAPTRKGGRGGSRGLLEGRSAAWRCEMTRCGGGVGTCLVVVLEAQAGVASDARGEAEVASSPPSKVPTNASFPCGARSMCSFWESGEWDLVNPYAIAGGGVRGQACVVATRTLPRFITSEDVLRALRLVTSHGLLKRYLKTVNYRTRFENAK